MGKNPQAPEPPGEAHTVGDVKRPLRLLVLVVGDPKADRPFSGSARNLVRALEARGVVHAALNAATWWADPWVDHGRLAKLADRGPARLISRLRWSGLAHEACSRRADRLAREHPGFDACLIYGTTFFPHELTVPVYCYFDATVTQNAEGAAYEMGWLPERSLTALRARQHQVFERCAGLFPRTAWAASTLGADYGVPSWKVVVAGAGWNHDLEPPPHAPYDARRLLFVGRDFERKGGPLLVEAFRRVREALPDARLVVAGCNPPGLHLEPGVEVVGSIKKDAPGGMARLLELYREASVFALLSRYEPFGIAVVEAMRSEVPCLVPDRFAFPEMVLDGLCGRTVNGYDPRRLAAILIEMLGDPAGLARMGSFAREHVLANWSWTHAAERICRRIEDDLARGGPALSPGAPAAARGPGSPR